MTGFLLVQTYVTPGATLVYIGPAFSRGGAYAFAFADLLSERLERAEPFILAMEVDNPSVPRMLERLLPSYVHLRLRRLAARSCRKRYVRRPRACLSACRTCSISTPTA